MKIPRARAVVRAAVIACASSSVHAAPAAKVAADHLADLTLEQLADVEVTSVTGRPERANDAAASIYVITGEDIRRSAATSLPEALRLAPNLQVARLNAGQYAITARGFNNAIGNKLLVLVDGRTVYSPLFSGVFWDAVDVRLQDIERIEVISGAGGTLWGANAVNGVINVITSAARERKGVRASARAGQDGSEVSAEIGVPVGSAGHVRAYALNVHRDNTERADGVERPDASTKTQVGFRSDWSLAGGGLTVQGDAYEAGESTSSNLAPRLSGTNLLGRWERRMEDGSSWQLQAYWDVSRRDDDVLFHDRTRTFDVQLNHSVPLAPAHKLIWGAGHRSSRSEANPTLVLFVPETRSLSWTNVFAQDEIRVSEPLRVTIGAKLESNVYTGLEVLPTLRAAYKLGETRTLWASASRAVRAPARIDRELFLPTTPPFSIQGGPEFESEIANVYELGYRAQPSSATSYSVTVFHHDYRRLRGGTLAPTFVENRIAGVVEGLEAWASHELTSFWRLSGGWLELRKSLRAAPGTSPNSINDLGNDPTRQWKLRSSMNLPGRVQLDVAVRHIGALPAPAVAAYTATDLRLAWQASRQLTLSLLVQNLFDPAHVEFNAVNVASQIPRSAFLAVDLRFD
jgi:iron complex outermembrane receptor protein